jgi:hypothetical protein
LDQRLRTRDREVAVRLKVFACRLLAVVIGAGLLAAPGCVGVTSHLMWWMGADTVPAEFPGLKGMRVAVICEPPQSSFGPDADAELLAGEVEKLLRYSVPNIKLVRQHDVAAWMDQHGAQQLDYQEVGKAVKAERLVVVKLKTFSYHANATLYQGKADYTVMVIDASDGTVLYDEQQPDFAFPKDGGAWHVTEVPEKKFRLEFIKWLANDIARRFHDNALTSKFADEPRLE